MYFSFSICPFVTHKVDPIKIAKFLTPYLFYLLFENNNNKIAIIKDALFLREKENSEEERGGKFSRARKYLLI